jgi:hypothetical protein
MGSATPDQLASLATLGLKALNVAVVAAMDVAYLTP